MGRQRAFIKTCTSPCQTISSALDTTRTSQATSCLQNPALVLLSWWVGLAQKGPITQPASQEHASPLSACCLTLLGPCPCAWLQCLRMACRVIELDVYNKDSSNPEPICKHGGTLTKPIAFRECVKAIKAHAFERSPYPVIITMENHTNRENQVEREAAVPHGCCWERETSRGSACMPTGTKPCCMHVLWLGSNGQFAAAWQSPGPCTLQDACKTAPACMAWGLRPAHRFPAVLVQAILAQILTGELGDMLFIPDPDAPKTAWKSPEELKGKILLRTSVSRMPPRLPAALGMRAASAQGWHCGRAPWAAQPVASWSLCVSSSAGTAQCCALRRHAAASVRRHALCGQVAPYRISLSRVAVHVAIAAQLKADADPIFKSLIYVVNSKFKGLSEAIKSGGRCC